MRFPEAFQNWILKKVTGFLIVAKKLFYLISRLVVAAVFIKKSRALRWLKIESYLKQLLNPVPIGGSHPHVAPSMRSARSDSYVNIEGTAALRRKAVPLPNGLRDIT